MSAPDSLLPVVQQRLETHVGLPPAVRDFVLKALHPAGQQECLGVPDASQDQSVLTDYRVSTVVSAPTGVTGAWDLIAIATPGDVNVIWWAAGPAGTDFATSIRPSPLCVAGVVSAQPVDWAAPRPYTTTAGAAAPLDVQEPLSQPYRTRRRYGGMTCYMTASALNDQGTVYASSFDATFLDQGPQTAGAIVGGTGVPAVYANMFSTLPMDENTLQLVSYHPYVAPARGGVYLPARFLSTGYSSTRSFNRGEIVFNSSFNLYSFYTPSGVQDSIQASMPLVPFFVGSTDGSRVKSWVTFQALNPSGAGGVLPPCDTVLAGMTTSVAIFRGLSNAASITLRGYFGLEVVPRVESPQRTFVRPPVPYSDIGLRALYDITSGLDRAYPASYNALGALLPLIGSVASRLAPYALRAVRALPGFIDAVRAPATSSPSLADTQVVVTRPRRRVDVMGGQPPMRGQVKKKKKKRARARLARS